MDGPDFQKSCCSLDLETNERGEIFAIGAILQGKNFQRTVPFNIYQVLAEFDRFATEASYLLGHNLIGHDLPVCRTLTPDLKFLNKPVVDTLYLSPIAFPENPYHRLVKNYKLVRDSLNDPLIDARLADALFKDQWQSLQEQHQQCGLLSFYQFAFSENKQYAGLQHALLSMGAENINAEQALDLFRQLTKDKVCATVLDRIISTNLLDSEKKPALAYCLAWLRVAGGNSVLPPWVRQKFQDIAPVLSQLRDVPCNSSGCSYCQQTHNPVSQLLRYFGFPAFRQKPESQDGKSLQHAIVQAAMGENPLFAVLPTGGGKSLCFQLPALIRYQRRGVLTIVISPLQALMKDQVDNLRNKTGAPNAAALNGLLTAPERGEVLQAIQMGDIALLYVSPEQLRNRSFQNAIGHREIGCWVFDEAHCLSKWGHDFRPDYLYAARFIKEFAQKQRTLLPAVQCFTATAKQDVKDEIIDYFRANLGQELLVFEGGVERNNLQFEVQTVNQVDKYPRINFLLSERLDERIESGSAIIYCAKRQQTEDIAEYLQQQDWQVEAFHAGMDAAEKKHIQENFIKGTTRIITATNAFGMGIDKDNVRLVIHADIPGSLENYLQEAGRAGRDQEAAECILLYSEDDLEAQFKLSALSQISKGDIAQILRGLRYAKKDENGCVVVTTGELLMNDVVDTSFAVDDHNAATKVITAVSWLEKAGFIERNENRTQVFQGRPVVKDMQEAGSKIDKLDLSERQKKRWLAILEELFNADSDEGFSADQLAQLGAFKCDDSEAEEKLNATASQRVIRTLYDMTEAGLIQKNLLLTAYIRHKVSNSSISMLEEICILERAMIQALQEQAPDAETGEWQTMSLRHVNQGLLDKGYASSNPEILRLLLSSLARDGQGLAGQKGSMTLRHKGQDQYSVKLNRGWKALAVTAERRQGIARIVLENIISRIPDPSVRSSDLLIEFAAEDLLAALKLDMVAAAQIKDPLAVVERSLNFMHELKIITLQKGLAVFRQAMTIQVLPESKGRRYGKGDYAPLAQHYHEMVFQVHVINEYARRGLEKIGQALTYVVAYFAMDKTEFVNRYFSDSKEILERATSQQSFQRIVSDLQNPQQIALTASHEDDNLLILAGPGSGKTRVVVHRCAYLLRVKRIQPKAILVLCFNRNAVIELRKRLLALVGDDAKGVSIQTYHGLSLRLTGHAMTTDAFAAENSNRKFAGLISEATSLLRGDKALLGIEADQARDRLLAGFGFILVDEYQDIDEPQYQLVSALVGRTLEEDSKLSILAVGDDDQNIYQFRGANVGFIRKFKEDYQAQVHYLVENYRSSAHIIAAANQLIQHNRDRMKLNHPIRINQGRKNLEAGGRWQKLDTISRGRVQIISSANEQKQASATVEELLRLRQLDARLDWSKCAILAKEWKLLGLVRAELEAGNIPLSLMLPADRQPSPFRVREIADFLDTVRNWPEPSNKASNWLEQLDKTHADNGANFWVEQLQENMLDWQRETDDGDVPNRQTLEFLYEILAEQRREQRLGRGVFLSTIHSVKGMEFTNLWVLDGGWTGYSIEEQRRLFYVAMTRAKETLCLMHREDLENPFLNQIQGKSVFRRQSSAREYLGCPDGSRQYAILGLQDFDMSYAGSFTATQQIHKHLANLHPGSKLGIDNNNGKCVITDGEVIVAVLSKLANQQWLPIIKLIKSVTVIALLRRYSEDCETAYRSRCKVEKWEVPMLEIEYER